MRVRAPKQVQGVAMIDEPKKQKDGDTQELSDGDLGKVAGGAVEIFLKIDGDSNGGGTSIDDKPKAPPPTTTIPKVQSPGS
jgi:hypothetical protein